MELTQNPEPLLFDHGIQNENSDIRAHVGVVAKTLFVFQTKVGNSIIQSHLPELRPVPAYQPGVQGPTAFGYLVKLEWFGKNLRSIPSNPLWKGWRGWSKSLSTSQRGSRAVELVCLALQLGVFPLWLDGYDDDRKTIQIKGTDIVIFAKKKIQVKCDFDAGPKTIPGCSGNLYLQISERNPLKKY